MGTLDDLIKNAQNSGNQYMYDLNHASDPAAWYTGGSPSPEELAKRQAEAASASYAQKPPVTIDTEVAKANMSPQDKQAILDAYQKQFGPFGTKTDMNAQLDNPNTGRALASTPSNIGPPAPSPEELQARRMQAASQTASSLATKAPIGRSNFLGNIPKGSDSPSIQDILIKLNGENDPAMQAAQSSRNNMQLISLLGKASNQILGGQTHTTPSNAVFDEIGKNAGQGIDDLKTKSGLLNDKLKQQDMASKLADEQAKNDPNSSVSNLYRNAIEKMLGGKPGSIPANISASALEKQFPAFEKIFAAAESSKDRAARAADLNAYRKDALGNRIDTSGQNTFSKETKDYTDRLENVGRFNKLVDEIRSGKLVDTHSISRTLTTDLSTLVNSSKSGGALTDRDEYAIHTFQDLISKIGQYAGKPISSIPKEYLDQLDTEANALKDAIRNAYDRKTAELINGTDVQGKKDIYKKRHDAFASQYDKLPGGPNSPATIQQMKSGNFDQDVMDYAKEHKITPEQANQIKISRTNKGP